MSTPLAMSNFCCLITDVTIEPSDAGVNTTIVTGTGWAARAAERREILEFALRRIVVEIAAEHDRLGFREFHEQGLVTGRVARGRKNDDRSVTEHIVVTVEDHGFAGLERAKLGADIRIDRICR